MLAVDEGTPCDSVWPLNVVGSPDPRLKLQILDGALNQKKISFSFFIENGHKIYVQISIR